MKRGRWSGRMYVRLVVECGGSSGGGGLELYSSTELSARVHRDALANHTEIPEFMIDC